MSRIRRRGSDESFVPTIKLLRLTAFAALFASKIAAALSSDDPFNRMTDPGAGKISGRFLAAANGCELAPT